LHIEIVYDNTNEEIQREERTKDDEEHEVEVHIQTGLSVGLPFSLK
jgi:hypothetical protein